MYIATDSPTNSIIFGIQDFFTGKPESRAFVTGNLINFDADDLPIKRYELIHELTHVWQNQNVGPIYMAHAIFAQATEGYNYGYDENVSSTNLLNSDYDGNAHVIDDGFAQGLNAETVLNDANGDFFEFNPEQQGQIMMHYFVRRVLLNQSQNQYAPWEVYVNFVRNNPQVA